MERLRLRRVRGGGRARGGARAARPLPRLRVPRDAHRAPCADDVPAAPRRGSVLHRRAPDPRHRRRESAAHTAHRDHPPVRGVRRVIARHELDARGTPDAGLAGVGSDPRRGALMSPISANIRSLTLTLAFAFLVTSIGAAYWTVLASDQLANDPFNPRLIAATNERPRGAIVDRSGASIATSEKTDTGFTRSYKDRSLAQVVGYASTRFGLSGVEAAYAESLIGQDPADPVSIWRPGSIPPRSCAWTTRTRPTSPGATTSSDRRRARTASSTCPMGSGCRRTSTSPRLVWRSAPRGSPITGGASGSVRRRSSTSPRRRANSRTRARSTVRRFLPTRPTARASFS